MATRYNENFKIEVVKAYMAGDRSISEIAADYNVAKSTLTGWVKKHGEECQYKTTTKTSQEEFESAKEIRRLNQLLHEKDKEIDFKKSGILCKGNRLVVYRFIDKNKEQFGLRWLCRHFKISLNCYYNYLKDTKRDYYEQRFMVYERIKYIYYNNNRTIGYRPMKIFLQRYGIYLSTTTIHKYMNKDLNLSAIVMRKKPGYKSCKKHKIFDNLLKQKFNVDEKNKIWCTDFTYMRQPNGKFRYNCTIMDLFDRSAIASVNSDYINTELAIETLTEALKKEKPNNGILLHSDQGVQYTSWEFVNFCKDNGVIQSMSKAGCPYDNAPMERFYNTFKNCFYYRYTFESVEQLDEMTKQYINWYNYVRPHSTNNYMTPMEFRYRA